jgi:hypothetical protein
MIFKVIQTPVTYEQNKLVEGETCIYLVPKAEDLTTSCWQLADGSHFSFLPVPMSNW